MDCYATMFCSWQVLNNGYLENILARNLRPEIGLQYGGLEQTPAWHKELDKIIKDYGLNCSVHLPFRGLTVGSADPAIRRHSREVLLRAVDLANIYTPDHLICHPDFQEQEGPAFSDWLENSQKGWQEILDLSPARLYMENSHDQSPTAIQALLARLPARASMCLDVGHWFFAAHGSVLNNLKQWLEAIEHRLAHLHLHDNDGSSDQHLGIGRGGINYVEFFQELQQRQLHPTFTLEAHNPIELECSLNWVFGENTLQRVCGGT